MADGKTTSQMQRDAQITGGPDQAHAAQIEGRLKDLHTCLPGIIVSFDPATQTAAVQPAVKRIFTERGATNLPVCVDVPVAFPGGGDFFLTFPVKAGDECILLFSERAIDYWHANGGTQLPAEYRLHDLSDGIAQVGLNSQPKKLAALQMDGAELRTRDRATFLRLTPGKIYIKGDLDLQGNLTQTGNQSVTGNTTAVTVTGTTDVIAAGKSGKAHTHSGVQTGSGNTGTPN
jgi:hypothetical protein